MLLADCLTRSSKRLGGGVDMRRSRLDRDLNSGSVAAAIKWLSDNGSRFVASDTRSFADHTFR